MRVEPMRKCAGCGMMFEKKTLIRVVSGADGGLSVDATQKKPGRGAYVCKNEACFIKLQKSKGLARSFKRPAPAGIYDEIKYLIDARDDANG